MTTEFDPDEAEAHLNQSRTPGDLSYSELLLRRAIDRVRELTTDKDPHRRDAERAPAGHGQGDR